MVSEAVKEEFWACTLSKNAPSYTFDPSEHSEEDNEHKLQINAACLGEKAKPGERNLVEVTTDDDSGKKVTCNLLSLKLGLSDCCHCDFGFRNSTVFKLKTGSGPISLVGIHLQALPLSYDSDSEKGSEDEGAELSQEKMKCSKMSALNADEAEGGVSMLVEVQGETPIMEDDVTAESEDIATSKNYYSKVEEKRKRPLCDPEPTEEPPIKKKELPEVSEIAESDVKKEFGKVEDQVKKKNKKTKKLTSEKVNDIKVSEDEPIKQKIMDNSHKECFNGVPTCDEKSKKETSTKKSTEKVEIAKSKYINDGNEAAKPEKEEKSKKDKCEVKVVEVAINEQFDIDHESDDEDDEEEDEDDEVSESMEGDLSMTDSEVDDDDASDESEDTDDEMTDSDDNEEDDNEDDISEDEEDIVKAKKGNLNKALVNGNENLKKQGKAVPPNKNTPVKKISAKGKAIPIASEKTPSKVEQPKNLKNKLIEKTSAQDKKQKGNKDKTPGAGVPKRSTAELKALLLKSPNLPKKLEKFKNLCKNNFKVADDNAITELWTYVEKNKK